jgi:inorganic pyrophosphatase
MHPTDTNREPIWSLMGVLFQAHPWHGVPIGSESPDLVTCYIEVVPSDTVKYEMDKASGLLRVDRPQRYSSHCPMPYGLVPQTLCDRRVAERCMEMTGLTGIVGDADPIDICVISERAIPHGNLLLSARPIGGLRMIDQGEADDKLIAVMNNDPGFGSWRDLRDCPRAFIDRLKHYFLTYKQGPEDTERRCEIVQEYGAEEARHMVTLAHEDYLETYGHLDSALTAALRGATQ